MSLSEASKQLLKIADDLEKDAAEVTEFVCDKCNHTASLATINGKRAEAAKTAGENVTVNPLTVEDKVHCPACEGIMAYRATEASESYYIDTEKKAQEEEKEEEEKSEKAASQSEPIDYDSLQRYTN